ncbi:MAG: hypothetical protein U0838_05315 [Chloroflexota bacterium]
MTPERAVRPERRTHRWFRLGRVQREPTALDERDDRSMRRLELAVAGCALFVVVLLSFSRPSGADAIRTIEIIAIGGVLFISALVSLIR